MLLNSLSHVKLPESPAGKKEVFRFHEYPKSSKILLDCFLEVLLMPYKYVIYIYTTKLSILILFLLPYVFFSIAHSSPSAPAAPGLGQDTVNRYFSDLLFKELWNADYIEKLKV